MSTTRYSIGTISVGAGSTSVTGTGTAWQSFGIKPGDLLFAGTGVGIVAAVASNTALTLVRGWQGGALSGANYDLVLQDDSVRSLVAANSLLVALGSNGNLTSIGALATAADRVPYYTGAGTAALATLTAFGRSLIDDADAAAARATLGLGTAAVGTVTTSANDATAGRLLKYGDFGLGLSIDLGSGGLPLHERNLRSGFYSYISSAIAGGPVSEERWHTLLVVRAVGVNRAAYLNFRMSPLSGEPRLWLGHQVDTNAAIAWQTVYSQNTTLGTVSQVAGVPTGALIQRGSNANGNFVRFADGLQICWNRIQASTVITGSHDWGFRSGGTAVTYAAAFAAIPRLSIAAVELTALGASAASISTTGFNMVYLSNASIGTPATRSADYVAIGHWF